MYNQFQFLKPSYFLIWVTVGLCSTQVVAEPIPASNRSLSQLTNVSQLRDVSPGDWAYQALQTLVERYGCIVGYPNQTFGGQQAFSRYEFAAGLNACLNSIERLIEQNTAIAQEDLDTLKRLNEEFAKELNTLGTRVDNLAERVTFLEDHQFSTTTKFFGEAIATVSQVFGEERADDGTENDTQATLNYRSRLVFDTSFSGEDRLRVRLQAANYEFARAGSNLTDFNFSAASDNDVLLNKLQYLFPVGDNATVWFSPVNITLDDLADPLAPFTNSFTTGSISFFGAIAPIYLLSDNSGPGFGASYNFTDALNLSAYYSAGNGNSPNPGEGLFNGQYVTGAQLNYSPTPETGIGLAYLHSYFPQNFTEDFSVLGFTGTANSDAPFGDNATATDNLALLWTWRINQKIGLEGWGMYTKAYGEGGERNGDTADIWNWKVSLAFPDLFKENNLGVITVGSPPTAYNIENQNNLANVPVETEDTPWLVELFYVHKLNDNISITPGAFVIINPENERDPLWVGTIRTSFEF